MSAGVQSPLKRGDEVVVITGKDKGRKGKITRVITETNRVVVEGVNMVKRHVSQRQAIKAGREPGIESREAPIHVSNVMMADPKDGKPTRIGVKVAKDGKKTRYAKRSGEQIDK